MIECGASRIKARHVRRQRGKLPKVPAFPLESRAVVTVNANGASVGKVFVRPADCLLTDDVIAVDSVEDDIFDLEYLALAIQNSVTAGGFLYEAKLFTTRVRELTIAVPIDVNGAFDLHQQKQIASATKRFNDIRSRLAELGRWSADARVID
ncbi:MAG: hypothetical protein ACYCOU_22175 [Sulfobacillus sp.]